MSAILRSALAVTFPAPKWALLFEVQDATGMRATRSADAIAMGLWPSVGLHLHGFEIKSSRADWRRELKDPTKALAIQKFCDRWWLVAADSGIVRLDELPPTWGLMAMYDGRLRVVRAAPVLDPVTMSRPFLAALLRRSWEAVGDDAAMVGEARS